MLPLNPCYSGSRISTYHYPFLISPKETKAISCVKIQAQNNQIKQSSHFIQRETRWPKHKCLMTLANGSKNLILENNHNNRMTVLHATFEVGKKYEAILALQTKHYRLFVKDRPRLFLSLFKTLPNSFSHFQYADAYKIHMKNHKVFF